MASGNLAFRHPRRRPGLGRGIAAFVLLAAAGAGHSQAQPFAFVYEAAQRFVAADLKVLETDVTIFPLDRRAQVPPCVDELAFDWPFPSRETLRVRCPTGSDALYLRLAIARGTAPTSPRESAPGLDSWRLLAPVARGQAISRDLVEKLERAPASPTPFRGPWPGDGERLLALRDLGAGEGVPQNAVRLEREVLEAIAPLSAGLRLPHEQLAARWRVASGLPSDAIAPKALPPFVSLARALRPGSVLRKSDLRSAVLVPKGSTVTVQIQRGELLLDAELLAEEDGALGERITVVNPESGRRLRAVVAGPGRAIHE